MRRNRETTAHRTGNRNTRYEPRLGTAFVHTVIDDHTSLAYAQIHGDEHDDEKAANAIAVSRNAVAWFAAHGISNERVLSDSGSAYNSHAWPDA